MNQFSLVEARKLIEQEEVNAKASTGDGDKRERIMEAMAEAENKLQAVGMTGYLPVTVAGDVMNKVFGTEYDTSHTPLYQAMTRDTLPSRKIDGRRFIRSPDLIKYLMGFVPRKKETK